MKAHPKLYDRGWLYEQYVTKQRTYEAIGADVGVTKHSIKRAMERLGIEKRTHTSKYPQLNDKEWLRRMYVDELLSITQLADLIGSTVGNINSALVVMGIPTRNHKEGWHTRFPNGRDGDLASNWRGGYPICEVCGDRVKKRGAIRCRTCEGLNRQGAGNINWKGGITPENTRIRSSKEYIAWREGVFMRDDYTCRFCGARSGNGKAVILNADHIKPFALFPELRLDLGNGRTLCEECHRKTDTFAGRMRNYQIK
jgi:hypothetical protein